MKRILTIILTLLLFHCQANALEEALKNDDLVLYGQNNLYGLKDKAGNVVVAAKYKKLIRVGEQVWIIQQKNKFGLINCKGEYVVKPKYSHVERIFENRVKLGNEKDYGMYDGAGNLLIPHEYTSIEPLFGKRYLTCKNYKYGIYNDSGKKLLDNEYDFIYMPTPKTLRIKYQGTWYELVSANDDSITPPEGALKVKFDGKEFLVTKILINTGVGAGYSIVTATDYLLKSISSISKAYEATIDELMLSQGADTVSIFIKLSWIPKFPVVYAKKYFNNLFEPNSGPLSDIRNDLIDQLK